jgi:hypothetical protein
MPPNIPIIFPENARMRQSNEQPNTPEPDDDPVPTDIHEFRNKLARRISRLVANEKEYWRGCRERACRRQRACAAPRGRCSNAPPLPPDPDGRRAARVMAQVQRVLRESLAREEGK